MEFARSGIRRKAAISRLQIRGVFRRDSYSQTIFEIAWITSGRGVERHCMTRACESSRVSRRKWSIPANLENKISRKSKSLLKRHARKTYSGVVCLQVETLTAARFCRLKIDCRIKFHEFHNSRILFSRRIICRLSLRFYIQVIFFFLNKNCPLFISYLYDLIDNFRFNPS